MFQKSVGVGLNMYLIVETDDSESLQMADGVTVVREAPFEGGKVLGSDQSRCGLLHGSVIQRFVDVPDECAIDSGPGRAMEYPIGIEFSACIMLGMEAVIHEVGGTDGNIFGQHGVERSHPVGRGPSQV